MRLKGREEQATAKQEKHVELEGKGAETDGPSKWKLDFCVLGNGAVSGIK